MKILIAKGQKEDSKVKVITSAPVDRPDVRKKIINQYRKRGEKMSNETNYAIEDNIRESQDDLWSALSTNEREEMLENAGFTMKRRGGQAEWLENNSERALELKKASAEAVKNIMRVFNN